MHGDKRKLNGFVYVQRILTLGAKGRPRHWPSTDLGHRSMNVAEEIPLLHNFIGKPILGGILLAFDLFRRILG